jgi:hypothetical protein
MVTFGPGLSWKAAEFDHVDIPDSRMDHSHPTGTHPLCAAAIFPRPAPETARAAHTDTAG